MNRKDYTEHDESLAMLLDGTLDPEQKRALQERLASDAGFRRFYLEYVKVHTLLRGELEGRRLEGLPEDIEGVRPQDVGITEEEFPGVPVGSGASRPGRTGGMPGGPSGFRLPDVKRLFPLAAGLLIVAGALLWIVLQSSSQGPTLASVTGSHRSFWHATDQPDVENPQQLSASAYDLRVGQIELLFDDGTVATVDAPARFALRSADHLHLSRGRVYVIAQEGTSGFRVSTPEALAVDLGTEFGVVYDADGKTQVHVIKGAVDLSEAVFDGVGRPTVIGQALSLTNDQAGAVTPGGGAARVDRVDPGLFVRRVPEDSEAAVAPPTLESWRAYRDRVRTDPDLVAAYDFTRKGRSAKTLTNIASSTGAALHGVLGDRASPATSPRWTAGRFPGSQALLFTPSDKQFVALPIDEALKVSGDLTTVWWMMPRNTIHRDYSMVVLGHGGPRDEHGPETAGENHMYAHGLKLGRIRAFHEWGEGENQEVLATPKIVPNAWTHVAIVRDSDSKRYHVYINGLLTDSLAYAQNATGGDSETAFATIGRSGGARLNHFDGRLDEMMIYQRALTDIEVADLYHKSRHDR